MNGLSNLDETFGEYTLALTDDLIRYWRSKGQGHSRQALEMMKASTLTLVEEARRLVPVSTIMKGCHN